MGIKVFFSYSHHDSKQAQEFLKHLTLLKKNKSIECWYDREMNPGQDVDKTIRYELNSADLLIALVSANYLDSYYCYEKEMKSAMKRRARNQAEVIPIILSPCDWKDSIFKGLLASPKDGKPISGWDDPNEAYLDAVNAIKKVIQALKKEMSAEPKIGSNQRKRGILLQLPLNHTEKVTEDFLDIARQTTNNIASMQLFLFQTIHQIVFDKVDGYWEMMEICDDEQEKKEAQLIYLRSFFYYLCNYCAVYLFNHDVRVHILYYDKKDNYYKKLIATYEDHEYQLDMEPIRYDEGLIAAATRHKKWSLLMSANRTLVKDIKNHDTYQDDLTIVLPKYCYSGKNPALTMGISIASDDVYKLAVVKYLNFCNIENVIQDIIDYYLNVTKMNCTDLKRVIEHYANKKSGGK